MNNTYSANTSVVDIVDQLLARAIAIRASDIHLEPAADVLGVRMRIDGILQQEAPLPGHISQQLIARLKVLANMDVAENRLPQDGSMTCTHAHGTVDIRVSTFPSLYGQKMVLRILDRAQSFLTLEQLGLGERYESVKNIVQRPQGLLLVTGPTGSGKTTTLYALLDYLNTVDRNIVTLEDPVEYHIDGITQGHIAERVGFGFAQGIRAILRQDPDVIMVGEIRDTQTAKTAINAAMTGHLVLSTLHTNDAPSAIIRLIDMGIEPYLVSSALSAVLAQRLVRVLCSCKIKVTPQPHQREALKNMGLSVPPALYEPGKCLVCQERGYTSRTSVFEFLPIEQSLRALIAQHVPVDVLREQALKDGMTRLLDDAGQKVAQGTTSLEELLRVCWAL